LWSQFVIHIIIHVSREKWQLFILVIKYVLISLNFLIFETEDRGDKYRIFAANLRVILTRE